MLLLYLLVESLSEAVGFPDLGVPPQRQAAISLSLPPSASSAPQVDLQSDQVDPENLLSEALSLGVFPAAFNNLRALGLAAPAVPESEWARRFRQNHVRNLALHHEETRLLAQLAEAGVPCRPIKGVRLVEMLYPDLSWREVVDIDLLLPPQAVVAGYRELKRLGLQDLQYAWDPQALSRLLARPPHDFSEVALRTKHRFSVELHWDWVGESFPAGNPADDLEALLVYLCRHAGKHFWSRLRWVCDLELYLRRFGPRLDWTRFWTLAAAAGSERSAAASFQVCSLLFGRQLRPEETRLAAGAGRRLARKAVQELLQGAGRRWWHHPAWRLLSVYNWSQRMSRCWGWLAPPPWHWTHPPDVHPSATGVWFRRYRRLVLQLAAHVAPWPAWKSRLSRAAELSLRDWWSLAGTAIVLLVVHVALRMVSFKRLHRWVTTVKTRPSTSPTRELIRQAAWSVDVAANHHLVPMYCLARSLALIWILARRGCSTELKLGVCRDRGQLVFHAWVEWGGESINDATGPRDHYALIEPTSSEVPRGDLCRG